MLLPVIGVKQLRENLLRRNPYDKMAEILSKDMHYMASDDPISLMIDDHIAGWFSHRVDDSCKYIYRLTTAFYKALVNFVKYDNDEINALIYPSVESEITGYNIVMEQKVVMDNLEVSKAIIFSLVHKNGSSYTIKPLKESSHIESDGKIIWADVKNGGLLTFNPDTPTIPFDDDQIFSSNQRLF